MIDELERPTHLRQRFTVGTESKQPRIMKRRVVAGLDLKCLGQKSSCAPRSQSEAFSISTVEGSRWRLRQMRAMGIEWAFAL
jgi:hypothetical protein